MGAVTTTPPVSITVTTLNAIRNAASSEYQTRVPVATQNNINTIANAITTYTAVFNEFCSLLGKVGLTTISSKMAENYLKPLKKGLLPYGKDIEEVYVGMAKAAGYDVDGATTLARTKPEIQFLFHRENRADTYPGTISKSQVKDAFTSGQGVEMLLAEIINQIYSGAEYDEFLYMKNLLASYEDNYCDYGIAAITDEASAKEFVKTVRKACADLKFMSDKYNAAGVKTFTKPEDQVLLINKDVIAEVDVEVLAKAFNMGKTDFEPAIIVVDDFGSMTDTYGLLIDKEFLVVYDTYQTMNEQFNAQGDFTNYFLIIKQVLSTSQFRNAIRFTTSPKVEE